MGFFRFSAIALTALALTAGVAEAKTLRALVNSTGQAFPVAGGAVALAPGILGTNFNAPAAGIYVITYTAECKVGDLNKYMSLSVVVDGVARSPTAGLDDGFCSSNNTGAVDAPAMHSVVVPVSLAPGNHVVTIRTSFPLGGIGGTLDDSTTIITD